MTLPEPAIASILLAALAAGAASYAGAYMKVKAEVRAATEGLRQTIENLRATTQVVESEKARIMIDSTMGAELRKAVYALATAVHALMHGMCWLSWDTRARRIVRSDLSRAYDAEAHKLIPEIFGQMAVIQLLDQQLHARALPFVEKLVQLDVDYGNAIVLAEQDVDTSVTRLAMLLDLSAALVKESDHVFGAEMALSRADLAGRAE
jgi:hypothetical protein